MEEKLRASLQNTFCSPIFIVFLGKSTLYSRILAFSLCNIMNADQNLFVLLNKFSSVAICSAMLGKSTIKPPPPHSLIYTSCVVVNRDRYGTKCLNFDSHPRHVLPVRFVLCFKDQFCCCLINVFSPYKAPITNYSESHIV